MKEQPAKVEENRTADDFLCDIEAENAAFEENVRNKKICEQKVPFTDRKTVQILEESFKSHIENEPRRQKQRGSVRSAKRKNYTVASCIDESGVSNAQETYIHQKTKMLLPGDSSDQQEKIADFDNWQGPTNSSNSDVIIKVISNCAVDNKIPLKPIGRFGCQQSEIETDITENRQSVNIKRCDSVEPNDRINASGTSVVHMAEVTHTYSRKRKRGKKGNHVKVSAWLQTLAKNDVTPMENKDECPQVSEDIIRASIDPLENGEDKFELEDQKLCDQRHEEQELEVRSCDQKLNEIDTTFVIQEVGMKPTNFHAVNFRIENDTSKLPVYGNMGNKQKDNILSSSSEKSGLNLGSKNMISMKKHGQILCHSMVKNSDRSRKVNQFEIIRKEQTNETDPYQFKSSQNTSKIQKSKKKRGKSQKTKDRIKPLSILSVISKQAADSRRKELTSGKVMVISEDDRDVEQLNLPTENESHAPTNASGGKENLNKKNKKCRLKKCPIENSEEIAQIAESISQAEDYDLLTCTQDVHNRLDMEMSPPPNKDISIAEQVQQNIRLSSEKSLKGKYFSLQFLVGMIDQN